MVTLGNAVDNSDDLDLGSVNRESFQHTKIMLPFDVPVETFNATQSSDTTSTFLTQTSRPTRRLQVSGQKRFDVLNDAQVFIDDLREFMGVKSETEIWRYTGSIAPWVDGLLEDLTIDLSDSYLVTYSFTMIEGTLQ